MSMGKREKKYIIGLGLTINRGECVSVRVCECVHHMTRECLNDNHLEKSFIREMNREIGVTGDDHVDEIR
jgi:hypothetical protein